MPIFKDNCSIKEVADSKVPLLLLIQNTSKNLTGTSADTVKSAFDYVNIMNFSVKNSCDVQIDRNASGGFTYNSFGKGLYEVILDGFQAPVSKIQRGGDIETFYNKSCISGEERAKIRITAAYIQPSANTNINGSAPAESITYSGYMVDFVKKPLGHEKLPGYGFTMSLLCVVEPKTTKK